MYKHINEARIYIQHHSITTRFRNHTKSKKKKKQSINPRRIPAITNIRTKLPDSFRKLHLNTSSNCGLIASRNNEIPENLLLVSKD